MRLHVEVTEDDIKQGEAGSCLNCPIALALQRHSPNTDIVVQGDWCVFGDREADLPPAAQAFIAAFDDGDPVESFAFDLDLMVVGAV